MLKRLEQSCFSFLIWLFHLSLVSKIIPRILTLFVCLILVLLRYRSILLGLFCLVKIILSVLTSENSKPETFAYSFNLFRVSCRVFWIVCMFFPLHVIVRSSAKRKAITGGVIWFMASFMAIRNRVTLRTEPCRTPFCISTGCELMSTDVVGTYFHA